jgi:hypothetical protein
MMEEWWGKWSVAYLENQFGLALARELELSSLGRVWALHMRHSAKQLLLDRYNQACTTDHMIVGLE